MNEDVTWKRSDLRRRGKIPTLDLKFKNLFMGLGLNEVQKGPNKSKGGLKVVQSRSKVGLKVVQLSFMRYFRVQNRLRNRFKIAQIGPKQVKGGS